MVILGRAVDFAVTATALATVGRWFLRGWSEWLSCVRGLRRLDRLIIGGDGGGGGGGGGSCRCVGL